MLVSVSAREYDCEYSRRHATRRSRVTHTMPLTDARIRTLKPRPTVYRVADRDGLCLEIRPTGARLWRMRYRRPVTGKPNMLSMGAYPAIGLQDARRACAEARAQLADGVDPAEARKSAANPGDDDRFRVVAEEWLGKREDWSEATMSKAVAMLENWAYPWIGSRRMREITTLDMLQMLRRPEAQGKVETAQRLKQRCGQIFRYGIPTGRCDRDPTADLRGVLRSVRVKHHASITDRAGVGALLRSIHAYGGHFSTVCALKLAPLLFVRPGELRQAEWVEFDIPGKLWRIPGEKMKMRIPHLVPLCRQALGILDELRPVTGHGRYLFPGMRDRGKSMSEATINAALAGMGYDSSVMTAHGFRSMASTLLNEAGWNADWIERQLAHADPNAIRGAYNYAQWLPDRARMMQAWADMLDELRDGAKVIPIRSAR